MVSRPSLANGRKPKDVASGRDVEDIGNGKDAGELGSQMGGECPSATHEDGVRAV
jgi:hypothetical protein